MPKRNKNGELIFNDYPDFLPNLSPKEIFTSHSFGRTYWRPIYSTVTKKYYKNIHLKYPFLKDIPDDWMTKPWNEYDKDFNKYKVKVGTTLEFWESKKWITKYHPYGWVHWLSKMC